MIFESLGGLSKKNRHSSPEAAYYYFPLLEVNLDYFGGLSKLRLPSPEASLKDSSSSKDNLIWSRTKIVVGAMA